MNQHKTLGLFLLSLFFFSSSHAQVRIFAGAQMTTAKYSILNGDQPTEFKQGFMAGIGLTTLVEGPLYFAPSLSYSLLGYKVKFNRPASPPDPAAHNNNTTFHAIAITPLLQFNLSKSGNHAFVRFGPGFDINVSGKEIFDSTGGKQINRSMTFGSTAYSAATAFANVQLGYQWKGGWSIYANYEHGLSNLNNNDMGPMILQRVVGVVIGYQLSKR